MRLARAVRGSSVTQDRVGRVRTADVLLTVRPVGRSGQRNECRRELFEAGDARSEVGAEWGACDDVVCACC